MDESKVKGYYRDYIDDGSEKRWIMCNEILYDMCREYPNHNNPDEVSSKLLIIGRTYAAALERGRNKDNLDSDDFYYKRVVGIEMMSKWSKIGDDIKRIKEKENVTIEDCKGDILSLHKDLMKAFYVADGENKKVILDVDHSDVIDALC